MKGKTAGLLFVMICIILAILLITNVINYILSGSIFAFALILLSVLSLGFKKKD